MDMREREREREKGERGSPSFDTMRTLVVAVPRLRSVEGVPRRSSLRSVEGVQSLRPVEGVKLIPTGGDVGVGE